MDLKFALFHKGKLHNVVIQKPVNQHLVDKILFELACGFLPRNEIKLYEKMKVIC